jgi:sporulation protein YlmC with PRC-barrel domain
MAVIALSELLGCPVLDREGKSLGKVREAGILPQEDTTRIAWLVVRTTAGDRVLRPDMLTYVSPFGLRAGITAAELLPFVPEEGLLLLDRDLLDQQIIDVNGRKVVRANDVELREEPVNAHVSLRLTGVDVGARGAVRRLLRGVVPKRVLHGTVNNLPARMIPWEFVNLIETDPARRVKLKISSERLAKLHPADIADILEELAPAEREAVFHTLDEEVAAETLEEVDPKLQKALVQSLDSERAADIVEEMDPDAAADLLAELAEEHSEEILEEMEPELAEEVEELLEFQEHSAAGKMTTDYVAVPYTGVADDAIGALREFEGGIESLSTIFLVDHKEVLRGAVPLAKLVLAPADTPLISLAVDPLISCLPSDSEKDVVELTLPVIDDEGKLTGVITADDVISLLREKI